jgi:glucose-6-phosphate isomerase
MKRVFESGAHGALLEHQKKVKPLHLRDLFAQDPGRFQRCSLELGDLLFDFSKNRITPDTLELLLALAREAGLEARTAAMFEGYPINNTEGRAVLHTALRNLGGTPVMLRGQDVMPLVFAELSRMGAFAEAVRSDAFRGHSGKPIRRIVNIGIGGSDLGPQMVCEALRPFWKPGLSVHFVSNVDGAHLHETLKLCDPEETLFIVASKTFTTLETLTNANSARRWIVEAFGTEAAVGRHFVAVSTAEDRVRAFGISPENTFHFWDWVGGRYSLWSVIGLPIALAIGIDGFKELLAGAHEVDRHFLETELSRNIPVVMGLLGIWYRNYFGAPAHAVIPYDQYLHRLPAYLQQADMESNGKSVHRDGSPIQGYQTGPVIFGEPGTNSQHAFFQLLHQGTGFIPVDFLAAVHPLHPYPQHHTILLANCLAQSEALLKGRTLDEVRREMAEEGRSREEVEALAAHRVFEGNRPSNTLLYDRLTPKNLGRLVALYEHRIFVQGVLWDVNSFDQWGVELGKKLAGRLQKELEAGGAAGGHDGSTAGLLARLVKTPGRG